MVLSEGLGKTGRRNSAKSRAKKGAQAMGSTGAEAWGLTQRGYPSALLSCQTWASPRGTSLVPLLPSWATLLLLSSPTAFSWSSWDFVAHLSSPFNHRFPGPENESQLQKYWAPGTGLV